MKIFLRASASAIAATVVDFGTLTLTVEVFHFFYPFGVALGAGLGAITNFIINRYWSFEAAHHPVGRQIYRYAIVSLGSLGLNTGGVYLVTEVFHLYYLVSKVIIALLVGWFFNYPLQKHFVYSYRSNHDQRIAT